MRFHIDGSSVPRPASSRTVYCDGSRDARFRDGSDLELSHWIPNTTPARWKADTSTAICLAALADGDALDGFDLAVNNHVDVDGILSVWVLVAGRAALAHCRTLTEAAEIGDFQAWGGREAMRLYQALALHMARHARAGTDRQQVYAEAFEIVDAVLAGAPRPEAEPGLAALDASLSLLDRGAVARTVLGERLVQFVVPRALAEPALQRALQVPRFCTPLSDALLLWPQARARDGDECLQLVSTVVAGGCHHDLWLPGYAWAETPRRWPVPGLASTGDSNVHHVRHAGLRAAAAELAARETARGRWQLVDRLSPFVGVPGRGFPVVLSFVDDAGSAASALPPDVVAAVLAPALAQGASAGAG